MNWKTEAMEKLRRYTAMRTAMDNIPTELTRLQLDAESIRAAQPDKPSVKGRGGKREDSLINNILHREELKRAEQMARLWVGTTDRALGVLQPEEKRILHDLYICPVYGGLERLCETLGVEKSSIYRKRDKALERFTLALYGELES